MRPGRNEPCPCGSGIKYKKCHLAEDETLEARLRTRSTPFVQATTLGAGLIDIVGSTNGEPIPEGGYDDCPICRATTPAERMRELRKHSVRPWN